jgi:hypothetical protein
MASLVGKLRVLAAQRELDLLFSLREASGFSTPDSATNGNFRNVRVAARNNYGSVSSVRATRNTGLGHAGVVSCGFKNIRGSCLGAFAAGL